MSTARAIGSGYVAPFGAPLHYVHQFAPIGPRETDTLLTRGYGAQCEEHWGRLGFLLGGALDDFQNLETEALVERHRVGFCIYQEPYTAELLSQLLSELDAKSEKSFTQPSSAGGSIDREPCDAQDWHGVRRWAPPGRERLRIEGAGRDGHESKNLFTLNRHIGDPEVVSKLVLAGVTTEVEVERLVA